MDKFFFAAGSIFAFLGVAAGAFGAHALKSRLSVDMQTVFETAARYQMYHAFALLAVSWALSKWQGTVLVYSGASFIVGILLFSGSLYLLAIGGVRWLGAITPIGGVAFLAGWLLLAWGALAGQ